ncbi:Alpha/beta-Hydrolases superfamily protein [Theobroma cacao]|uniref:Phospholipase A1 n=1 Tax=Theobroma cacao TaxID=3641 RepID=A0A061GLT0_THECC|nr:Alpha/beta-Hydrolases superfamily protein [Theobroma cacao]
MASSIASRWRELSGEKNWEGLLHPLDLDLRRYIIHYLQRAGAAGDLFNNKKASKSYGLSLYPPDEYFSRAGLEIGNPYKYRVTNFIYGTVGTSQSEYFGFVAVATDEGKAVLGRRDILVSWRGSMTRADWSENIDFVPTSAKELFGTDLAQVHSGFLFIYAGKMADSLYNKTSARDQALKAVQEQVDKYQNEDVSITVTGHSLGAALATLNAMDIVANSFNKPTGNSAKSSMVTAFPVASPRVGNLKFMEIFDELKDLHLLRIVNSIDPVPNVPIGFDYTHVGEELGIDTTKSTYLKSNVHPHNLDVYGHGVAGVQENGEFKLEEELEFDNAVVNKTGDCLLDEYKIPIEWWNNEKFKGMVQMDDGHWKFVDSAYVPDPPSA